MVLINNLIDFFGLNTQITTLPELIQFVFELFFACMLIKIVFLCFFRTLEYIFNISK